MLFPIIKNKCNIECDQYNTKPTHKEAAKVWDQISLEMVHVRLFLFHRLTRGDATVQNKYKINLMNTYTYA